MSSFVLKGGASELNSKQLKRQFCAAIVMVLVGIIALSSATYAWYSINGSASVEGISITAQTDGTCFEITAVTSGGVPTFTAGATTASLGLVPSAAIAVYPIHPIIDNTKTTDRISWGHAISYDYDDANADAGLTVMSLTPDTENHILKSADSSVYALVADFYIRLNPNSTDSNVTLTNIIAKNVQITDNSPEGEINLLTQCVYLVVEGESGAYEIANSSALDSSNPFIATTTSGTLIDSISTADTYKTIRVYAFFEGQDKDCKSSQYSAESITISLSFEGTLGT